MRYFHQWKIKLKDRYKQTIISHKNQKQFNIIVMNFKNSFVYVQCQTNLFLKNMRKFAKTFIDDIIIFSRIRKNHLKHLKIVFERLFFYDVIFNFAKKILNFFFLILLNQIMNALKFITAKKKLIAIVQLIFSRILNAFEIYLKLTEWMRNYVSYYVQIVKSLQNWKTIFLKNEFIKNNFKKTFFKKTFINQLINVKYQSYEYLQIRFSKSNFLIYFKTMKLTFIDVDVSKKKFQNHDFSCSKWFRKKRHYYHQKRNSIDYVF